MFRSVGKGHGRSGRQDGLPHLNNESLPKIPKQEMQSRLEFAAFDTQQQSLLSKSKSRIERVLPKALDRFYDVVRKTPETARFFKDEKHMTGAKAAQSRHWNNIATANFDEAYYERASGVSANAMPSSGLSRVGISVPTRCCSRRCSVGSQVAPVSSALSPATTSN
ncbi:hypothetical protein KYN89_12695 [Alteriqipengyuania sp. NZ-12B]|uniref:Globin-sensor domain-containing protein n=2 Tax=Alteriqipengyuania abyssalis TaxID=2860200 RepID=A0ABS7PG11_9SPHN|nr:hypothetical protein [Alteriqipengyuania abyssalis]